MLYSFSILSMNFWKTSEICETSSLEPWKPLFTNEEPNKSTIGFVPLFLYESSFSRTNAAAAAPIINPCLFLPNGRAAFWTSSSVVTPPATRKPDPIQGNRCSLEASSAAITITLLHRPVLIQSSAIPTAWVVEAQAALIWVLGPFALMSWANCECPIDRILKRKFLLNCLSFSRAWYSWISFIKLSYPGKAEAKIIPVSSCKDSGNSHFPSSTLPVEVVKDDLTKGIPASANASRPAQIASWNVISKDSISFSSNPKSVSGSKSPNCPAKLITFEISSISSKEAEPSADLTSLLMFLLSISCLSSWTTESMKFSPANIASMFPSSKTFLFFPGKPIPIPVTPIDWCWMFCSIIFLLVSPLSSI